MEENRAVDFHGVFEPAMHNLAEQIIDRLNNCSQSSEFKLKV